MTSFWLVQRQPPSKRTDILTATKNTAREEYVKVEERHNQRFRKNAAEKITNDVNDGHQKTRYSSQIGLIYLKPVVRYSTSVFFHSHNDFSEEPGSSKDIRYAIYSTCVSCLILAYKLRYFP